MSALIAAVAAFAGVVVGSLITWHARRLEIVASHRREWSEKIQKNIAELITEVSTHVFDPSSVGVMHKFDGDTVPRAQRRAERIMRIHMTLALYLSPESNSKHQALSAALATFASFDHQVRGYKNYDEVLAEVLTRSRAVLGEQERIIADEMKSPWQKFAEG